MKLFKTFAVLALFFIIIFLSGCNARISEDRNETINATATLQPAESVMTFEVIIPRNTPLEDTIYIYLHSSKKFKMHKMDELTFQINLTLEQLEPEQGNEIRYRYGRNGYDFHTAEYLGPTSEEPDRDTNDYFWTKKGRTTTFESGKLQRDKIVRWRWFPEEGINILRTTSLEPKEAFQLRINNVEFRSGQVIEDLYADAYYEFFNSTAEHMVNVGYNWIELDPPWQWTEENGLPKVANLYPQNPNYPDDETFLEELRAYKRMGLKIMVGPQLCCTSLNTKDKSKEWWDAYFDETERFLMHFAALAEEGDADAFFYAVPSWELEDTPIDLDKKWRKIFGNIRTVFRGEVGQMIWVLGPDVTPTPVPIPDTNFVTWGDALDFFYVSIDYPISIKDNPTDEELQKGAEDVLDGVKPFYEKFRKPIIVRNGYFNVKYSWKGQTFYAINSVPWISDPEAKLQESVYQFDTIDHARTINAYFLAMVNRPWVIGYFHFGYTHWEDPLSPWMSIRGKPAEDLWMKWNKVIYSNKTVG